MDITIQPRFSYYSLIKSLFSTNNQISTTDYLLNTGRASLFTLLNHKLKNAESIETVLLPELICDDVSEVITKLKIPISYYPLNEQLDPDVDFIANNIPDNHSILLVPNYFGSASNWKDILDLKNYHNITIVEDNAHSLFGDYNDQSFGTIGDISFNSLRKILPTLGGSILKFNDKQPEGIKKSERLPNMHELKVSLASLKPLLFKKYPSALKSLDSSMSSVNSMDVFSKQIYNKISRETICSIRKENYKFWQQYLKNVDIEPIKLREPSCPYVYPCYARNFSEVEKFIEWGKINNITIINWPKLPINVNLNESKLSKIVCFPVNHQYRLDQIEDLNDLH